MNGLPDIERVDVSDGRLEECSDEADFNALGVELAIEAASWVCVASNVLPADTKAWNCHQAVLGGQVTRFYKLFDGLLDQTSKHRREFTMVFGRMASECIINVLYLMKCDSEAVYDAFLAYSLRHETRLLARIDQKIEARGGVRLPIEDRMLSSISRSFQTAGLTASEVTKEKMGPWLTTNLFDRAEAVGLDQPYLAMIGGASHSVHGSWQDLLEYHLDFANGCFTPAHEWHEPRPQMLFALSSLTIEMLDSYFRYVVREGAEYFSDKLEDLHSRLQRADEAHERYLTRSMVTAS